MKWIKALNLQQWADSIPAKVIFPALIADLIRATANSITEIRFPNGDKGQVRGYDGVLKAEGVAPMFLMATHSGNLVLMKNCLIKLTLITKKEHAKLLQRYV
ncbi:hypothetical protein [Escherichia coli]|uniref:hypothetical protein n=1 Tax=Escherichia coli TaxID=562 RepID=UPI001F10418D|nr:hypothetical protein [Escherichia coli]